MKSYLSVDLDYWMLHMNDTSSVKFFNKLLSLGKPIRVVQSHEELLPQINESKADVLYNIDYHADIFGFVEKGEAKDWIKRNDPEDGTWGVYVDWRKHGSFCWMHPHHHCMEHGKGACWKDHRENPFNGAFIEWKKAWNQVGRGGLDLSSVAEIGVAVSPDWTELPTVWRVANLLGIVRNGNLIPLEERWKPFWFDPSKASKNWYSEYKYEDK